MRIIKETENERLIEYKGGGKSWFVKCTCSICGESLWRRKQYTKKTIHCRKCAYRVYGDRKIGTVESEEHRRRRSIGVKRAHAEGKFDSRKKPYGKASFDATYNSYIKEAGEKNLIWDITEYEFRILTSQTCYYCGKEPSQTRNAQGGMNGNYYYNGLDRTNNTRGYELNNVVPCCKECNFAKRKMDVIKFLEMIERIHQYQQLNPYIKKFLTMPTRQDMIQP